MLARLFDRRCRGYEAVGYTVLLPTSAVDTPLASLFVHAARTFRGDAGGVDRARSATEAFLFRRLWIPCFVRSVAGQLRLRLQVP